MNILNNKNKRISIFKALALCLFAAVSLIAAAFLRHTYII